MKFRYAYTVGLFFIFLMVVCWIISVQYRTSSAEHVRCSSFVRMDLAMNISHTMLIDAVINFQRNSSRAILLIKGTALTETGRTTLSRELVLIKKQEDERSGYEYTVKNINAGPTDNTPSYIFNEFLSEISSDNHHVYLDDEVHRDDALLIGGPYSILFMCIPY